MRLTVHSFLTLDGVAQGPGSPEEDPRDGFTAGGWVVPHVDDGFGEVVDSWFARAGAFLFGRVTFEMMRAFWPQVTDPDDTTARLLNTLPKHLVSSTVTDPGWGDTTVVAADVLDAVRRLKAAPGDGELQVHGCTALAASLHAAGLVDEYRLLTFPVTVGAGRRLFTPDAPLTGFRVVDSRVTPAGVTYAALVPAEAAVGTVSVVDGAEQVTVGG
ncbi:dihydrofolate reductase family protein [Rhodococcus aerolatus]